MRRTVIGLFKSLEQAEKALREIENEGFANNQISLVVKKDPDSHLDFNDFLILAENINLPNVGNVTAGGPLAGALIQGDKSLAESLSYYGVGGERPFEVEKFVNQGYVLAVIETNNEKASQVANVLEGQGAHHVEKWSKSIDKPLIPWG
ncbi:MAG: hypothetical protein RO469_13440 [Thermincola sp.]|jgi:hypothetical protein|nr:hypothetical protein [Thermincola sp.]MDT3703739.1 hypothetical protein [Thermincola sp.]